MDEIYEANKIIDNDAFREHELHTKEFVENCSECFKGRKRAEAYFSKNYNSGYDNYPPGFNPSYLD